MASWSVPRVRCPASRARFLLAVAGVPNLLSVRGPSGAEEDADLGIAWLEWSNFLADVLADSVGDLVPAEFFDIAAQTSETVEVGVRPIFARSPVTG